MLEMKCTRVLYEWYSRTDTQLLPSLSMECHETKLHAQRVYKKLGRNVCSIMDSLYGFQMVHSSCDAFHSSKRLSISMPANADAWKRDDDAS
mmetsp:Transcript_13455/g.24350  ORF Transcript_13455/g.24350 Transcript_13455/m.24350 type:complete len:92 (+) Transcript_13455:1254-1529(+)